MVSHKVWRKMHCSRKAKHKQMALKRHFHSKTHFGMFSISLRLILIVFFSDSMLNNGHIKLRLQLLACRGCQTLPSVFVGRCTEMRCHSLPTWHSQIKSLSLSLSAGAEARLLFLVTRRGKTTLFWGWLVGNGCQERERERKRELLSTGIFGVLSGVETVNPMWQ